MNQEEQKQLVGEFEKNRQMLYTISTQKQQSSMQLEMVKASLEELGKTKEEKVLKAVGNILVQKETKEVIKELEEKEESIGLRVKTLQKQEENTLKKLNSIKSQLEAEMKQEEGKASDKDKTEDKKKRN